MTINGTSEPVIALLDEIDGNVVVRQHGGTTGKHSVKNLRPDTSSAAASQATTSPTPIVEESPDLSAVSALCPICRQSNTTAKFAGADSNLRISRVRLVCDNHHEWELELPQAPRNA